GTSIADPAERAAADRPAFDQWLAGLRRRGIEPDATGLWDDYRVGALSGYFMAVFASMSVERTARGDEMFAVMAERPARQALMLGSLDLLSADCRSAAAPWRWGRAKAAGRARIELSCPAGPVRALIE